MHAQSLPSNQQTEMTTANRTDGTLSSGNEGSDGNSSSGTVDVASTSPSASPSPSPSSPSPFRKTFAVSSLKSLNRRQTYVLVLDFLSSSLSFHKVRKGKEVKRTFPFSACVKLERVGGGVGVGGLSAAAQLSSGNATVGGGVSGVDGSSIPSFNSTQLIATFGHEPRYKKVMNFASVEERELFCNLVHAMIVSGSRAVKVWKKLQEQKANNHANGTDAANTNGSSASVQGSSNPPTPLPDVAGLGMTEWAEMDFCSFLISFSSAQTQLSLGHAAGSTTAGSQGRHVGAVGVSGEVGSTLHDRPGLAGDDVVGEGRARANASDPQAALLAFLSDPTASSVSDGRQAGLSALASPHLLSMLHGRLLEGETPINSSDITYRVECSCGGIGNAHVWYRKTGSGGSAMTDGPANSPSNASGQSGASGSGSGSGNSNIEVSNKGSSGITASSRGLFLLTNYRILYLNYNDGHSYGVRETNHRWSHYLSEADRAVVAGLSGSTAAVAAAATVAVTRNGQSEQESESSTFDPTPIQHRLSIPSPTSSSSAHASPYFCTCDADIPLGLISRVSRSSARSPDGGCEIRLQLKDGRKIDFGFDCTPKWVEGLLGNITRLAHPGSKEQEKLFAFHYAWPGAGGAGGLAAGDQQQAVSAAASRHTASPPSISPASSLGVLGAPRSIELNGWELYDALYDYRRCSLARDPLYRICTLNADWKLCATYPRLFMTAAAMKDDEVKTVAAYRSQNRLPAVVWIHPVTRATLSRCAQPLVGLKFKRSEADEHLVSLLRSINPSNNQVLHIFDARPWKAAMGNTAMGKGFENISNYEKATLQFMNIDNIHAIRNSLDKLQDVCNSGDSSSSTGVSTAPPSLLANQSSNAGQDETFLSKLENSLWLHYIRLVLSAATKISIAMSEEGASCITHCSDGWDRTSQLSALTQLMLDPFYRTLEGFAILIEKEWLSFGHRFAERYGHASAAFDDDQRAPIFLQFLDCCYQLLRQFPASFEFDEEYLIAIHDHVSSHRFGTFLFNMSQERVEKQLDTRTISLWTFLLHPQVRTKFVNPAYIHPPHVGRWRVEEVRQTRRETDELLEAARKHQEKLTQAHAAGRAMPSTQPPSSLGMPPIPPLTTDSIAQQLHASYFLIPSVSTKRLVLWEKMHLRYDREYMRTQSHIQTRIRNKIRQALIARSSNVQAHAHTTNHAVTGVQRQSSGDVAVGIDRSPSSSGNGSGSHHSNATNDALDAAWQSRYQQLCAALHTAGIDVDATETTGKLVHTNGNHGPTHNNDAAIADHAAQDATAMPNHSTPTVTSQ